MKGLRLALAFLTRIPVGSWAVDGPELGRAVVWFPVVGAFIGAVIAIIYAGAAEFLPNAMAALFALTLGLFLTGALHEDGLADTVDAFAGGWTRAERLRILQDPRHGTFGVLALICSVGLLTFATAALQPVTAVAVLIAGHALSRATAVALLGWVPPAGEGLGADYARNVTRRQVGTAAVIGVAVAAAFLGLDAIGPVAACAAIALSFARLTKRKIGGVSGDVLGATQQVALIAILLLAAG